MHAVTVVGARPQFIKSLPVTRALRDAGHRESILHTGQHYDHVMSEIFFDELELGAPAIRLDVGSGTHGRQTAEMLWRIEEVLIRIKPDVVIVYGDTNTTLAGALASCKLGVPLAHVEAGLRSFNRSMPEEHNRVLTDHCSDLLFCPTRTAVDNLNREGISSGVHFVGDPMLDSLRLCEGRAKKSDILQRVGVEASSYVLATIHRSYNTDTPEVLQSIMEGLGLIRQPVVLPLHPRTRRRLEDLGSAIPSNISIIEPVGYIDMIALERQARVIVTDSGGVQKEAYFLGIPCVTVRPETEWVETLVDGWNQLAGSDPVRIAELTRAARQPDTPRREFGDGNAAQLIVRILSDVSATSRGNRVGRESHTAAPS